MAENGETNEIKLRNYQAELFEKIRNQNAILFLPTGSGKTCIALWLMKSVSKDIKKPIANGGKRIVFLVNTVELVHQQAAYIIKNSSFSVVHLSGEVGVDYWKREEWKQIEDKGEVMVMTTQIYCNALTHSYLSLEDCRLIVFDECHHAVSNHPMRQVMDLFSTIQDASKCPQVLGLSATLLHANTKENDFYTKIEDLRNTFKAEIFTSNFREDVAKFATKPCEVIEHFPKVNVSADLQDGINKLQKEAEAIASYLKLRDDDLIVAIKVQLPDLISCSNARLVNLPGLNRTKFLKSALKDIVVHLKGFGPYVAYVCCGLYIIQMYRFLYVSDEEAYQTLISYFINVTQIARKMLFLEISKIAPVETFSTVCRASTEKLKYLLDLLCQMKPTDNCIVFVERKMTARSLYKIIKMFSTSEKSGSHVKVDFVIGTDCNPLRNTREGLFNQKKKRIAIENFKKGKINVIVATNILEEGIDLQNCNYVVMFDELKTYRSYVQSKGRARMKTSRYIILNDVPRPLFESRLKLFRSIECKLGKVILEKAIETRDASPDGENADGYYITEKKAAIKPENSIPLIYRYCSTLPRDLFTVLTPYWWITKYEQDNEVLVECKLQLPVNSAISSIVEGPKCTNIKSAKQAVAFEAVKMLHKAGALDDHLLPFRFCADLEHIDVWLPNAEEKSNSDGIQEDSVYMTYVRVPKYLENCRPRANQTCFLHVIRMNPRYEIPKENRKQFCHGLMVSGYEYGILTRNRLPRVCQFPVYSDLGRIDISIECNHVAIVLNSQELLEISKAHAFLFMNVLKIVEKCFTFDLESKANDYFIVPLKHVDGSKKMALAWKVITQKIETKTSRPTDEERANGEYTEKNYYGKVVSPWYHETDKFCIVTEVNTGIHFQNEMEGRRETFAEYYKSKYNLTPLRPSQPMMEVRMISYLMECIKPRPITASAKQKRRLNKDFRTYLPAEFCCKQPFPSVYWYKSVLLPSVLHRFYYLLVAEELRQKIATESGVGNSDPICADADESEYFVEVATKVPLRAEPQTTARKLPKPRKSEEKVAAASDMPKDIYHELHVTLEDVEKYTEYVEAHRIGSKKNKLKNNEPIMGLDLCRSELTRKVSIEFSDAPSLFTLKRYSRTKGPNQYQILQALTLKGASDTINLERLETLGDSFLKYLVSFAIFKKENKMNEGLLTQLKSCIIGNKYLFSCGKKMEIPSYVNASAFNAKTTWYPPSFCVPLKLREFISSDMPPVALTRVKIPYHEQFSGYLSLETVDSIGEDLVEFLKEAANEQEKENPILFFINKKKLSRKSVADVVEALIGVYLETCGIEGAFKVMRHFGILHQINFQDLMCIRLPSPASNVCSIESLLPDHTELEKLFGYQFRDKAYLLQALTHPSCMLNTITDCYQKLEFIGDAVLDFLITSYIYEHCGNLPPGGLTDLRSALVNNNTFGALSVRLNLHKYILAHSTSLQYAIETFVDYQEEKSYEIHGNELMKLVNEEDVQIAEEVDVPKALGDVFESIAGAIFLDSGFNLETVWYIYYNIMKDEIDKFSKCIPINPIRALYEMNFRKIQFLKEEDLQTKKDKDPNRTSREEKQRLRLFVTTKRGQREFRSQGINLAAAKRAAAKLALKEFGKNDFVI